LTFGKKVRFIDLFAGIGGFHHAALKVFPDAECVMAVEWDKDCQKVYSTMFPETDLRGDIREILTVTKGGKQREATAAEIRSENLVPEHDILFAGFPCQPFSKGGAQKGMSEQTQGTLFHEIMRIIEARRPQLVVLENVANLVGHDEGRTWSTIINALREARYFVDQEPLVISPHEIKKSKGGAPQNRPRVYIVAVDSKKGLKVLDNSNLLNPSDWRTASSPAWHIESIFKASAPEETALDKKELRWLEAWDDFVKKVPLDVLPGFPIWTDAWYSLMRKPRRVDASTATLRANLREHAPKEPDWWTDFVAKNQRFYKDNATLLDKWFNKWKVGDFPESRRKLEWQARRHHPTRRDRTLRDCLIQFRPSGIRVKPPTYAPALVAMAQTPIVGLGDTWRRIGPFEAGSLQGFTSFQPWRKVMRADAGFRAGAAYKQFGNAVHIGVAALVLVRASRLANLSPYDR
jgi:DNA (cytosine-5)-methyltransferase 1